MAENNKYENNKFVELLWYQKYNKIELGEKIPIEKPNLPFQTIETINKPRIKDLEGGLYDPSKFYPENKYPQNYPKDWKNLLIWGDNKLVMSSLIKQGWAGKINLIYIDPPFFTGADFTVRTKLGNEEIEKEPSIIEERAYRDTWSGGIASYLRYMYERLILMRDLLSENGSIYIHIDPHLSHYAKVMMDEIFDFYTFRNEIIWVKGREGSGTINLPTEYQSILLYKKSVSIKPLWNPPKKGYNINTVKNIQKDEKGWFYSRGRGADARGALKTYVWGDASVPKEEVLKIITSTNYQGALIGDVWDDITNTQTYSFPTEKPEALLKRIILASSKPGDIVADFFCGSGTTLAVAEKLGRRWLGSDLSKFAIQVTRKRFLDIYNSKDLEDESKKEYGKPARPFELWNIGNYETVYWQEKQDEYLEFMLKLYQAKSLNGFKYLHGSKGDRAVHIGPLNAPVTMEEIEKVVIECRNNNFNKADVLGWEWSYDVNELAKTLAKNNSVDLKLIQIPSVNEIKSSLVGFDLQLLKVPFEAIEKELLPHIKFVEVAYLEIETNIKGNEVTLKITDFQIPPTAELSEIASKLRDSRELIDYWAIDWDYKGDTFHNQWQSFRLKKNPKVDYEVTHSYENAGEYQIMIKVVDVFGNDTNKVLKVRVK